MTSHLTLLQIEHIISTYTHERNRKKMSPNILLFEGTIAKNDSDKKKCVSLKDTVKCPSLNGFQRIQT